MALTNATSASLFNSAILGFDAGCVEISDRQVYRDGTDELYETQVTVGNTHGYCADGFYRPDRNRDSANTEYGIREGQFGLTATMAADVGYLVDPLDEDPVNAGGSSFAFEMTDYVGAVDPNARNWFFDWLLMDVEDNCPLVRHPDRQTTTSMVGDACDRDTIILKKTSTTVPV